MGFVYGLIILFFIAGGVSLGYHIYKLIIWLQSNKVKAQIIRIYDETWNKGKIQFTYSFIYKNKHYELDGNLYETLNLFHILFPKAMLGTIVTIRFHEKKKVIADNILWIITYILISLIFIMLGGIIILLTV